MTMFRTSENAFFRAKSAMSQHALRRMKDRSIPQAIIEGLQDYGVRTPGGSGADIYAFNKKSWRRFSTYLGLGAKHFERYRDAYIVASADGRVITVGWRH
jgi:hypothetical protein